MFAGLDKAVLQEAIAQIQKQMRGRLGDSLSPALVIEIKSPGAAADEEEEVPAPEEPAEEPELGAAQSDTVPMDEGTSDVDKLSELLAGAGKGKK